MNGLDPIAKFLGAWSYELGVGSIMFKFALALLLSAIIGCERATKMHDAGLRTFIITALVATGTGLVDKMLIIGANGQGVPILSCATIIGAAIGCTVAIFTNCVIKIFFAHQSGISCTLGCVVLSCIVITHATELWYTIVCFVKIRSELTHLLFQSGSCGGAVSERIVPKMTVEVCF